MDKRFWAIIGVLVIIFGGILVFNKKDANDSGTGSNAKPTSHITGKVDSDVKFVEYGDYQCPVCENYYPIMQQVQEKYGDRVAFQFRNLPLTQIHKNAFAGARAAEAADLQGKFWEMHDALYDSTKWQEWSTSNNALPYLKNYAKELGLNMEQFNKDFESRKVNSRINADVTEFDKTKQSKGTPSFFINGKYYANTEFTENGTPTVDGFSKVLDKVLAETTKQ